MDGPDNLLELMYHALVWIVRMSDRATLTLSTTGSMHTAGSLSASGSRSASITSGSTSAVALSL
jgi:hypothetical protein